MCTYIICFNGCHPTVSHAVPDHLVQIYQVALRSPSTRPRWPPQHPASFAPRRAHHAHVPAASASLEGSNWYLFIW